MNSMRRATLKVVLLSCVYSILTILPCAAGGAEETWKIVREQAVEHKTNVCGFETLDFGVTVGYGGESHYTSDGGATWPKSETVQAQCRFGLDILDSSTAVSAGNGGTVVTVDGCRTWSKVNPSRTDNLSFSDRNTGWVADRSRVFSTEDGGVNWKELTMPADCDAVSAVARVSRDCGYFITEKGRLFRTTDGGAGWSEVVLKVPDPEYKPIFSLCTMRFQTPENGLIVTWSKIGEKAGWLALSTADGGGTWKSSKVGDAFAEPYISRNGKLVTLYESGTKKAKLYALN